MINCIVYKNLFEKLIFYCSFNLGRYMLIFVSKTKSCNQKRCIFIY